MLIGEVRSAEDGDFEELYAMAKDNDRWVVAYSKNGITVWTKSTEKSPFNMIKVQSLLQDLSVDIVYDVLHDSGYRKVWDRNMIEGHVICVLDANNDLTYYSVKTPPPLKNRDFVTQRSWTTTSKAYMLMNHSVYHKSAPPKKGFIRGVSYFTGYVMEPAENGKSCLLTYVTLSDPRGNLPSWLVNKLVNVVTPKIMQRIKKACKGYEAWKQKSGSELKPWLWPHQITSPFIDWVDVENTGHDAARPNDETEEATQLAEADFADETLEGLAPGTSDD